MKALVRGMRYYNDASRTEISPGRTPTMSSRSWSSIHQDPAVHRAIISHAVDPDGYVNVDALKVAWTFFKDTKQIDGRRSRPCSSELRQGRRRGARALRERPRRTKGIARKMAGTTTAAGGQVGRSLPQRSARQGHRAGRIHPYHAARHAARQDLPQHRGARPHPSIGTSAAENSGVYRVVTADDIHKVIPDPYYGPAFHDQPILAIDKVRFVGEPVAVVLARSACCRGGDSGNRGRIRGIARGL
jgi:hypothetical protein